MESTGRSYATARSIWRSTAVEAFAEAEKTSSTRSALRMAWRFAAALSLLPAASREGSQHTMPSVSSSAQMREAAAWSSLAWLKKTWWAMDVARISWSAAQSSWWSADATSCWL